MTKSNVVPMFSQPVTRAPHEAYKLEPGIETALVRRVCEDPGMWAKLGQHLDANALALPGSKEAIDAADKIVRETGRPPRSAREVLQAVAARYAEGKTTLDTKAAVKRMFDTPAPPSGDDVLVHHVGTILKRRFRKEASRLAVDEITTRGDGESVMAMYERARAVGVAAPGGTASFFDETALPEWVTEQQVERATTGVLELDTALRGGLPCGCLGVLMAATGKGKSMGLIHISVANALWGRSVLYLTGELRPSDVKLRIAANLFGASLDALRTDAGVRAELQDQIEDMSGVWGAKFRLAVEAFEPKVATPSTMDRAVEAFEDKHGVPVQMLVVDYADKLRPDREQPRGDKGYAAAGDVYEALRLGAERGRRWVWTASQATRSDGKRKSLDVDHIADSIEKARVCDLLLAFGPDGTGMVKYRVAKFRHGASHDDGVEDVTLPHDFVCARLSVPADPSLYPSVSFGGGGLTR
jgi:hypothetical protein